MRISAALPDWAETCPTARALAEVADGTEYVGAVAGASDGVLSGNYYSSESVPGGVDGFTYAGQTEAVDQERLLRPARRRKGSARYP